MAERINLLLAPRGQLVPANRRRIIIRSDDETDRRSGESKYMFVKGDY